MWVADPIRQPVTKSGSDRRGGYDGPQDEGVRDGDDRADADQRYAPATESIEISSVQYRSRLLLCHALRILDGGRRAGREVERPWNGQSVPVAGRSSTGELSYGCG